MRMNTLKNWMLLCMLCLVFSANATYQPKFSTAGFFALNGSGRTAYSMNIAWRFVKKEFLALQCLIGCEVFTIPGRALIVYAATGIHRQIFQSVRQGNNLPFAIIKCC